MWGSSLDITERKKAEDALNERTTLLTGISENVTDLIFAKDREGQMIFANPATLTVIQRSLEEVIGKTDVEWSMHEEQSRRIMENDRRVLETGCAEIFDEAFGDRVFESLKAPLRDNVGNIVGVVGVARDVTELKRTQAALRESEERFRLMADSAPVLIWLAEPDRGCIWVNQQWLAFTGRNLDEELGDGWMRGIHPDDVAQCRDLYTRECARRVAFQMDYRLRRFDGEYRWVLDCAAPRLAVMANFSATSGAASTSRNERKAKRSWRERKPRLSRRIARRTISSRCFPTNYAHR
jgi:PAS domain S-box-containing protein